jgi:hypothetical protein
VGDFRFGCMDGSRHRDLGDIRRWKTVPLAPGSSSSADLANEASGLLGWLASASRALEKAAVEPAWAVDEAGLATAMALLGQLLSLTDRLEVTVTAEVLERDVAVLCAAASDGPDGRGLTDRELASTTKTATAPSTSTASPGTDDPHRTATTRPLGHLPNRDDPSGSTAALTAQY